MHNAPTLATRFSYRKRILRAHVPLTEDRMREVAPSIFAAGKHASRSERYTYLPTIDVLRALKREGFEPFMVAQGASRTEGKAAFTKHMIRLRHRRHIAQVGWGADARTEIGEVILINRCYGGVNHPKSPGVLKLERLPCRSRDLTEECIV